MSDTPKVSGPVHSGHQQEDITDMSKVASVANAVHEGNVKGSDYYSK